MEQRRSAARIDPLEPPYEAEVAESLRRMMPPSVEPHLRALQV